MQHSKSLFFHFSKMGWGWDGMYWCVSGMCTGDGGESGSDLDYMGDCADAEPGRREVKRDWLQVEMEKLLEMDLADALDSIVALLVL